MKIAIDIGHANQTGAKGYGLDEHHQCSLIASALYSKLEALGHTPTIIDYPTLSNAEDLEKTIATINTNDFNFGVSLHLDSSSNPAAHGAHVCYFPGSKAGIKLATAIADHLCTILPGRADHIVGRANLAILRRTRPTWVLCECGFISNKADASFIFSNIEPIATAIANGISNFLASH